MTSSTSKTRANRAKTEPAGANETAPEDTVVDFGEQPDDTAPVTTVPDTAKEDREKATRDIYSQATKELREKYRAEFTAMRVQMSKDRGIDWKPELTSSEKAEAQLRELIEKHPELASKLGLGGADTEAAE